MMLAEGATPLYFQLKHIIKTKIESRELKSGQRLPSENDFCEEYKVSRATVRQALMELEREGFIYRQRGKGTFVTDHQGLKQLSSKGTIENLIAAAKGTRFTIIDRREITPPAHVAKTLGIEKDQTVTRVQAVRSIPKGPMGASFIFLPARTAEMISWAEYREEHEFIVFIEAQTQNRIYRASQTVSVALADKVVAEHLCIEPDSPVLVIERDYYIRDGTALYMSITYNRPDRFQYKVELTRS